MKKTSLFKESILATLFILIVIFCLSRINLNSDLLNPISKAFGDFRLTDVVFAHIKKPAEVDTNIVLVNIGPAPPVRDRDDLARMIEILVHYKPKVIAIDAFYRKPRKNSEIDSSLVRAFAKVDHLVLVSEMFENAELKVSDSMATSHSMFMKYAESGFAEMITRSQDHHKSARECIPKEIVRKFPQWVDTTIEVETREILKITKVLKDTSIKKEVIEFGERTIVKKDTTIELEMVDYGAPRKIRKDTSMWVQRVKDTVFYSFPVKIASIYAPEKAKAFLDRNNDTEIINFQGNIDTRHQDVSKGAKNVFYALDCEDLKDTLFDPSILRGKIVMIGYLGDRLGDNKWEDKFFTPLNTNYIGRGNPDMYGVVVHANIVSMILKGDFIDHMPEWINNLLNLLLIFFNMWLFAYLYHKTEVWYDGLSVVITIVLILVLMTVVVVVFNEYKYVIDITLPSVALFLSGNMIEIYFGIVKTSVVKLKQKIPIFR